MQEEEDDFVNFVTERRFQQINKIEQHFFLKPIVKTQRRQLRAC